MEMHGRTLRNDECLNGIAYNPLTKEIWFTGKDWPIFYQLEFNK